MFENWFIIGARLCCNCKVDIDVKNVGIDCEDLGKEHIWHNDSWEDMCCVCGRDYEMMYK
jgi:hypothetical protein